MATYIPLNDSKRPTVKGWNLAEYRCDEPGEGYYARRADDYVIVDCDSKEATLLWSDLVGEAVATYIVRTPRGLHYYYKWTPGSPTGPAVGVFPGIDIRSGMGSYAVWHTSPGYEAVGGVTETLPFNPTWLPAKADKDLGTGEGWDTVPSGRRNDTLAALAGTLRAKGMSAKKIAETLVAMNATYCEPPLDTVEVQNIARSIGRYEPDEETEILMAGMEGTAPATGLWGNELQKYDAPPLQWVVDGLIPEGLTILAGKPKIGKSWMSLGIAAEVARGGTYMDRTCVHGQTLYLALEDTLGRLKRRMEKVMNGDDFPADMRVETAWPRVPECVQQIHSHMSKHPDTRLVIIDTLAKVRHEGTDRQKGTYQDDYSALTPLKRVADEYGIAVVVIHHLRKGGADDVLDEVSGTTGLAGAADTILVLKQDLLEGRGRDLEDDVAYEVMFDRDLCRWEVLGEVEDETRVTVPMAWYLLENGKPGDKVPNEMELLELGIWTRNEVRKGLDELREDPRFYAVHPKNPRSALVISKPQDQSSVRTYPVTPEERSRLTREAEEARSRMRRGPR